MMINLRPEDEKLIQKQLQTGVFTSAEEVIHRALESLDADEAWLDENKTLIGEQIERGIVQFEQGQGLSREDSISQLEAKKANWRAEQQRA